MKAQAARGYTSVFFFCKPKDINQIAKVKVFDAKVGVNKKQKGYQRHVNQDRIRRMADQLNEVFNKEDMFDLGVVRLIAPASHVEFNRNLVTIKSKADMFDAQHRCAEIHHMLESGEYEAANGPLNDIAIPVLLFVAPEDVTADEIAEDIQKVFVFSHRESKNVSKSQHMAMEAIDTLRAIDVDPHRKDIELPAFRNLVLCSVWDQIGKDRNSVWFGRVDLMDMTGVQGKLKNTIFLSELVRTSEALFQMFDIQHENLRTRYTKTSQVIRKVITEFWITIAEHLPDMCRRETPSRLMSTLGIKALQRYLIIFLNYSYNNASDRFNNAYKEVMFEDIVNEDRCYIFGQPLIDLLDQPSSLLIHNNHSETFWGRMGDYKKWGGGFEGILTLAQHLWQSTKHEKYAGSSWAKLAAIVKR
jgi:DGQHR domain-containing protein